MSIACSFLATIFAVLFLIAFHIATQAATKSLIDGWNNPENQMVDNSYLTISEEMEVSLRKHNAM